MIDAGRRRAAAIAIAYPLSPDAPLDVTIQSVSSGHRVELGKNMRDDLPVVLYYRKQCVGAADQVFRHRNSVWLGPVRALTGQERVAALGLQTVKPHRGGSYLL